MRDINGQNKLSDDSNFHWHRQTSGGDFRRDDHNKNKQYRVTVVTAKEQKA
jgi:hypothetical protein